MACVTALSLRDMARKAMLDAGGRGFVRFLDQGELLVSDAIRRCEDDAARDRLMDALGRSGFKCREQSGLLMITPGDALLEQIAYKGGFEVNWDGPQCAVQTLAARWLARRRLPLTQDGRQLLLDVLRLTWQNRASEDLDALRAQAAVMQREGDTSGFAQAGAVLADWCDRQEGKHHED